MNDIDKSNNQAGGHKITANTRSKDMTAALVSGRLSIVLCQTFTCREYRRCLLRSAVSTQHFLTEPDGQSISKPTSNIDQLYHSAFRVGCPYMVGNILGTQRKQAGSSRMPRPRLTTMPSAYSRTPGLRVNAIHPF